jgi:hypothetical protein
LTVAKVEGLKHLIDVLDGRRRDAKRFHGLRLAVGYSAPYAIYVHENLQAHHPIGQAKFLETPARVHAKEIKPRRHPPAEPVEAARAGRHGRSAREWVRPRGRVEVRRRHTGRG